MSKMFIVNSLRQCPSFLSCDLRMALLCMCKKSMPPEVILSTELTDISVGDTFDIWCLYLLCTWVLCEFIIHMGKCVYSLYRWGSVRIYGDAKNAKTQRGLHPPRFVLHPHLDLYCNATQCISSKVMQGSNKLADWEIKDTDGH